MTSEPEELVHGEVRQPASEAEYQALAYDAWFREVASPGEVAERDRRIDEAEREFFDAFEAGDRDRLDVSESLREHAFWALPISADFQVRAPQYDAATYDADRADDDGDGWY